MTKSIIPFDIVLVPFPFADLRSQKKRPCVVLAVFSPYKLKEHYVVAMMTSHLDRSFPHDVVLKNYEEAGLPKPTLIRVAKVVTIDSSIVIKRIGSITAEDKKNTVKAFNALFETLR